MNAQTGRERTCIEMELSEGELRTSSAPAWKPAFGPSRQTVGKYFKEDAWFLVQNLCVFVKMESAKDELFDDDNSIFGRDNAYVGRKNRWPSPKMKFFI